MRPLRPGCSIFLMRPFSGRTRLLAGRRGAGRVHRRREDVAAFAVARPRGRLEGKIFEDPEPSPRKDDFRLPPPRSHVFRPLDSSRRLFRRLGEEGCRY